MLHSNAMGRRHYGSKRCVYGIRLDRNFACSEVEVHLVVSEAGWRVLKEELGWDTTKRQAALEREFMNS